jgi:hypothetical protein
LGKNIKLALALLLTAALASTGVVAQAATQADAVPAFEVFSNDTCVREPNAEFSVPAGVTPTSYEIHVESEAGAWSAQGNGLISSVIFLVPLASKNSAGQTWKNLRLRFVYGSGGTATRGPWTAPIPLDATAIFRDSAFCAAKKIADDELARQATLPGEPILSQVTYENDSRIVAVVTRPTKPVPITTFSAEQSLDGTNWTPATATLTQLPGSTTVWTLAFRVVDTTKNITSIRVRANNNVGSGPWTQVQTGRPAGASQVNVSRSYTSEGYALFTNPIALPSASSSPQNFAPGCTFTSVELSELNAAGIEPGDVFSIETSLEEGPFKMNGAPQLGGTIGTRTVAPSTTGAEISQIAFRVQLCTQDIQTFQPRYMKVRITKTSDSKVIEGQIKVLTNDLSLGTAIENSKFFCGVGNYGQQGFGSFTQNLTIEQTAVQRTSAGNGVIRGTLFRSGFVAANQKYQISVKRGSGFEIISRGQTDSRGQFVFRVRQSKTANGTKQVLYFFADESATGAGLLNEPFAAVQIPIEFLWTTRGLVYQRGTTDWIPKQDSDCGIVLSPLQASRSDDRHPVAWFLARQAYYGMKNKQSREYIASASYSPPISPITTNGPIRVPSSGSTFSNLGSNNSSINSNSYSLGSRGGSTWVRGYTTKSGKRVSGHFRKKRR